VIGAQRTGLRRRNKRLERGLGGKRDARVRLHGDIMNETLRVPAAQAERGRGGSGFIGVQSGEGDAMPDRGWRDAQTPEGQRTGNDPTCDLREQAFSFPDESCDHVFHYLAYTNPHPLSCSILLHTIVTIELLCT
jgi:hypothetical protein